MTNTLLKNCDLLSFAGGKAHVEFSQDIAIHGDQIHAIQKSGEINEKEYEQVIDASGLLAVPGFINTHAHVPMVLLRNLVEDVTVEEWFNDYIWPMESNLTEEDVYWGAQLGLAEMIENGVTCVADHYFFMDEVAKAVEQAGTRANLVWAVFGHQGEEMVDKTIEFTKRWQGGADGRITTWLGPHAPYTTSPEFLKMCAEKAKQHDLGIHIHVAETKKQTEMSLKEFGITPVKQVYESGILDVPSILAHVIAPQGDDFDILAKTDTGIGQAPKTYLKAGMGMAPIDKFMEYGINFGLATDGAVSNNTLDIMEQMRLLGLYAKFLKSDPTFMKMNEILDITFRGSARVMHMADKIGELKAGMLADITLIRQDGTHTTPKADPLAALIYCSKSSDVDTVLCNGKLLMQGRKLLTLDKEKIQQEVQSRLNRLSKRLPEERIAFYPG